MKDASKAIRIAAVNALAGLQIMDDMGHLYDVATWDRVPPVGSAFPRLVVMSASGGGARFSKVNFGSTWQQIIKAVMFYQGDVTTNLIDDLSSQVVDILVPRLPPFIDIGPDFNIWNVEATLSPHVQYADEIGNYIERNIILNYSLTQN